MNEKTNHANMNDLRETSTAVALHQQSMPALPGTEIGVALSAAQGKAMVEARYVMALKQPRNMDQVRVDILQECKRPAFARNKSAYYVKPIGEGAEGLGIRFAEVAIRCMKNVLVESPMVYEDDQKEVHRIIVTDLESNATYVTDVRVSKYVERSKPMDGGQHFGVRKNSYGKNVYTVLGTDDDLLNKRAALISKAIRTLALRIIPGDIQDEAEAMIKAIRLNDAAQDPNAERKRIADAFAEISVQPADLTEYLGHELGACSPAELVKLRGVFGAIRDGELTWAEVMANKDEKAPPPKEKREGGEKTEVSVTSGAVATDKAVVTGGTETPESDGKKPPRQRRAPPSAE